MPRRRPGQILPFRIPFFRIFYSTTYTIVYFVTLCFLAITPVSMVWAAIQQGVYQYPFMIGGTYGLVILLAIFIYTSRLYTNRTVLAGVGKAYIPVEDGEAGRLVRKMIVKQLERSAIIAWESRPRDLLGEILRAEELGLLPPETASIGRNDYTVGRMIPLDPSRPPWGIIEHEGWSSPSQQEDGGASLPNLQFDTVIAELPHLVEAKAVSLAPPDPMMPQNAKPTIADAAVAEALRRPSTMGLRDYLLHLAKLGVLQSRETAAEFLAHYEFARFSGQPVGEKAFKSLMDLFSALLAGMTELDPTSLETIRHQASESRSLQRGRGEVEEPLITPTLVIQPPWLDRRESNPSSLAPSSSSGAHSPVTARTRFSRNATPYLQQESDAASSVGSFSSVIHRAPHEALLESASVQQLQLHQQQMFDGDSAHRDSASLRSFPSDTGSVVVRRSDGNGEEG